MTVPLHVSILGSGPAGCFTAQELLRRHPGVRVDLYEREPEPFGLLRYGVAPDHGHTRRAMRPFQKVLDHPEVHLHLGIEIGQDVTVAQLAADSDAVVVAVGAAEPNRLGVPGEELPGCLPAVTFAAWANGRVGARIPIRALAHRSAVIIGHGNVALDVARLLLRDPGELEAAGVAPAVTSVLRHSRIRHVHLVGRRGPAQVAFREAEWRELVDRPDLQVLIAPEDLKLDSEDDADLELDPTGQRASMLRLLQEGAVDRDGAERTLQLHFRSLPTSIHPAGEGLQVDLDGAVLDGPGGARRALSTGPAQSLEAGLVVSSIGHRVAPLSGLPYDESRGHLPVERGRIQADDGSPRPGLYAAGWAARPAHGLIGHNKPDARTAVLALLGDLPQRKQP